MCLFIVTKMAAPVKKQRMHPAISTLLKWKADFCWIKIDGEGPEMTVTCDLCVQHYEKLKQHRNFSDKFILGVTGQSLKRDNMAKHNSSLMHQASQRFSAGSKSIGEMWQTPIGRSFKNANKVESDRVARLFDVAYELAKMELPFSKGPRIARMEDRHGLANGQTYVNRDGMKLFTNIIGEVLQQELVNDLKQATYFSFLCDGTTDVANIEKELIYVLYINEKGLRELKFWKLQAPANSTAVGLKEALEKSFQVLGVTDYQHRIVGMMSDGAAVNLGRVRGLSTRLRNEIPWLVAIHCLSHRLELSVKDALSSQEFTDVMEFLKTLHYLYRNSPKKWREVRDLAKVLEDVVLKPTKVHGTRWLEHKQRACASFVKSFKTFAAHFETQAADKDVPAADGAKYKGLLQKMSSFRFVIHLLFFIELLEPLSKLSILLQGDAVDLLHAHAYVDAFFVELDNEKDGNYSSMLTELIAQAEQSLRTESDEPPIVDFNGISLSNIKASLKHFQDNKTQYINNLRQCIETRFGDLSESNVLNSLNVLDITVWPNDKESLSDFGKKEIQDVISHFHELFLIHNVEIDKVLHEWIELKFFRKRCLSHLSDRELFWGIVMKTYSHMFPNLMHVIKVMQVLPASNAKLERFFSVMNRVKSDWRNRLSDTVVEHLVRIKLEGPDVMDEPLLQKCLDQFFSVDRRPNKKQTATATKSECKGQTDQSPSCSHSVDSLLDVDPEDTCSSDSDVNEIMIFEDSVNMDSD